MQRHDAAEFGLSNVRNWGTATMKLATALLQGLGGHTASIAVAVALFLGCDAVKASGEPTSRKLPSMVARVGDVEIASEQVRAVMRTQGLSADRSLEALVQDAVLAQYGQSTLDAHWLASAERTALARLLLERLWAEVAAQPGPTGAEMTREAANHWWEFDRPAAAKTTHAVVRVKKPADEPGARALASRLRERLVGVTGVDEFLELAKGMDAGRLEIVAESLPPVAVDGRIVPIERPPPGANVGRLVSQYALAANALEVQGEISPVVETEFGYHIIYLEGRLGAHVMPIAEQRRFVAALVPQTRAKAKENELLGRLRRSTLVEISRAASNVTGQVKVDQ